MEVLQKPASNEYNTKQQKKTTKNLKNPHNLPKAVNQITWCFTVTEQREKKGMKNQVRSRERSK